MLVLVCLVLRRRRDVVPEAFFKDGHDILGRDEVAATNDLACVPIDVAYP